MSKNFLASLDKLYEMLGYIREKAKEANFDEVNISKIELACEEALVNIITYGYPEDKGYIEINCQKTKRPGIKITIKDHGFPHNPLTNAKAFDPQTLAEVPSLGGYGVFFILKMMDEVAYKWENNANLLTLIKYLT